MYSVRSKTKQKQKSPSIYFLPLMWGRVTLAAAHAEIRNQPAHCVSPRVSPFWNRVQKMKLRKSSKEMALVVPELTEASPTISSRYLYTSQINTPCRWWSHRSEGLWLLFGLCPAGPNGLRPRHQASHERPPQGPDNPFLDRVNWPIDLSSFIGVIKENLRL